MSELVKRRNTKVIGERRIGQPIAMMVTASVQCTWRTEARVSAMDQHHAREWFQQAHLAGARGRPIEALTSTHRNTSDTACLLWFSLVNWHVRYTKPRPFEFFSHRL